MPVIIKMMPIREIKIFQKMNSPCTTFRLDVPEINSNRGFSIPPINHLGICMIKTIAMLNWRMRMEKKFSLIPQTKLHLKSDKTTKIMISLKLSKMNTTQDCLMNWRNVDTVVKRTHGKVTKDIHKK